MTDWPITTGVLELGELPLSRGEVLRDARLGYQASSLEHVLPLLGRVRVSGPSDR